MSFIIANSNFFQDLHHLKAEVCLSRFNFNRKHNLSLFLNLPLDFPADNFRSKTFVTIKNLRCFLAFENFCSAPKFFFQENLHLLNDQSGLSKLYPDPRSGVTMIFILLVLFAKITLEQHFNMPGSNYIPFNLCLKTQKYSRDLESNPGSPALKAACLRTF